MPPVNQIPPGGWTVEMFEEAGVTLPANLQVADNGIIYPGGWTVDMFNKAGIAIPSGSVQPDGTIPPGGWTEDMFNAAGLTVPEGTVSNPNGTLPPGGWTADMFEDAGIPFSESTSSGPEHAGGWTADMFPDGIPTSDTTTTPTTSSGEWSTQDIRDYQKRLNSLGANLVEDGKWGPLTQAAYEQYGNTDQTKPPTNTVGDVSGGTSGTGGTGGTGGTTPSTGTGTSEEDIRFTGLPGKPEIWQDSESGMSYVVFFVPGMEPEVPMLWEVPRPEDLQSFFGEGETITYDRIGTSDEIAAAGALNFGTVDEVVLRGENPYSGWESQFERESKVMPFLNDPEVAAIIAAAWMEGREPTEGELTSAEWFMSKTAGEQEWYTLLASQPETAKQLLASNTQTIRRQLEEAGVYQPPDSMVDYITNQWTTGLWTDEQVAQQTGLMADPLKAGERNIGLMDAIAGVTYDTTADKQRYVESEVRRWLGPAFGNWTESQVNQWASRLRNDPDASDALQTELSRQRLSAYSEYEDPFLTYEDIASPWRNLTFNAWGQNADESSAFFTDIVKANDAGYASAQLRQEGLNQGVKQVEDKFLSDMTRSFSRGSRGYGA